ncbi:MAG TPA: hypothetical protein VL123_02710 [Candidatus Udaeobacter sp.]|nr:hypothetical protein [Candidatus Udaeobacter sp.]
MSHVPLALAVLAAMAAPGVALLARATPSLDRLERLAYGIPLGTTAGTFAIFLLACVIGLSPAVVIAWAAVSIAIAAGLRVRGPRVDPPVPGPEPHRAETSGKLFAGVVLAAFVIRWAILWSSALRVDAQGLEAGFTNLWADWSEHLGDVASFAYGGNFPPVHPRLAGHAFSYHYLTSVTAAALVRLGVDPIIVLPLQSFIFSVALLLAVYAFARRIAGNRVAAALATLLFLLGGGWGFSVSIREALRSGGLHTLLHAPWDRGGVEAANYRWPNMVFALIAPQRAYLYGLPLGLLVLRLLPGAATAPERRFFLAGVVAGLLPLAHQGTLLSLALITPLLVLLFPARGWLTFFVAWIAIAVPQLLLLLHAGAGPLSAFRFHPGWIAAPDPWGWFWLKNLGLILPLAVAGLAWPGLFTRDSRRVLFALMPAFLIANLFIFQPWDWDNTKILTLWYLGISILCGAALAALWRRWAGAVPRIALGVALASMVLSGLLLNLDEMMGRDRHTLLSHEELDLARMIRERTPPHALFAAGLRHNHPVAVLSGRRVLIGYPAWLWSQGIDSAAEERDLRTILAFAPGAPELIARYGIDYVVVGPEETEKLGANPGAYASRYPCVIRTASYSVFAVGGASRPPKG